MDTPHNKINNCTGGNPPPDQPRQRRRAVALMGAPASNTAPANYTCEVDPPALVLRNGVDSLYLSFPGKISEAWNNRLYSLKLLARSEDPVEQAKAQISIGDHVFEVRDKGQGKFAYVLIDNWYSISLPSCNSTALPLASVQISSELLTGIGVSEAAKRLRFIIGTFGAVQGEANISRVDLFVDFISYCEMDTWNPNCWITRAHKIDRHYDRKRFSGWSVGKGGSVNARLYNKTIELEKRPRDYLKPLWIAAGWDEYQYVWRLEFEYKRDVLKESSVSKISDLIPNTKALWRYGTDSWLRLTIPSTDKNQNRWPTHPLWAYLSAIDWKGSLDGQLTRVRKIRVPSDKFLYENALGGLTSFMASKGITDIAEGFGEYLAHAEAYHNSLAKDSRQGFRKYIGTKVAQKGRRYNTLSNIELDPADQKATADNYRRGRDGE